jgi:DNA-binding NtrC family response regulator
VLVIEDDNGIRALICSMLARGGYDAVEAVNGFDGMDALRVGGIDLVLTDVIMPQQTGTEAIPQIRQAYPRMPIIAMSGWVSRDFAPLEDAIRLGANRVLEKPFRPDELMTLVRELLEESPAADRGKA